MHFAPICRGWEGHSTPISWGFCQFVKNPKVKMFRKTGKIRVWFLLAVSGLFMLGFSHLTVAARSLKGSPTVTVRIMAPQTGRASFLRASLVEENITYASQGRVSTQLVYEALVPSEVLSSLVDSKQRWGNTYAVKVTIWMYYASQCFC